MYPINVPDQCTRSMYPIDHRTSLAAVAANHLTMCESPRVNRLAMCESPRHVCAPIRPTPSCIHSPFMEHMCTHMCTYMCHTCTHTCATHVHIHVPHMYTYMCHTCAHTCATHVQAALHGIHICTYRCYIEMRLAYVQYVQICTHACMGCEIRKQSPTRRMHACAVRSESKVPHGVCMHVL